MYNLQRWNIPIAGKIGVNMAAVGPLDVVLVVELWMVMPSRIDCRSRKAESARWKRIVLFAVVHVSPDSGRDLTNFDART